MRPTKERLEEIQKELYDNSYFSLPVSYGVVFSKNALLDLLVEIDALNIQIEELKSRIEKMHPEVVVGNLNQVVRNLRRIMDDLNN